MTGNNNPYGEHTQAQIDAYNVGWAKFMVKIFVEQIEKLRISDSGSLMQSIEEITTTGTVTTIEHKFLEYGIYVAAGVGNGFKHGNGGDLEFMGWRAREGQIGAGLSESHMLSPKFKRITVQQGRNKGKEAALVSGEHRQRRDWQMKKYYYSMKRLNETNAKFYGAAYSGMTSTFLDTLFAGIDEDNRLRSNRF